VIGLLTLSVALIALSRVLGPAGAAWAVVAGLAVRVLVRIVWAQSALGVAGLVSQAARAYLSTALSVGCFMAMNQSSWLGLHCPGWQAFLSFAAAWMVHAIFVTCSGAFGAEHLKDWAQWRHTSRAAAGAIA
jgi:hypothetical protein